LGFAKKADPDQIVLEQLRKAGSDLSKPHKIEFFLYFPTQSSASKASVKIKEMGFEVEMKPGYKRPGLALLRNKDNDARTKRSTKDPSRFQCPCIRRWRRVRRMGNSDSSVIRSLRLSRSYARQGHGAKDLGAI
jgi:hypothetical protein